MQLANGDEKYVLKLCMYKTPFGKFGYIYVLVISRYKDDSVIITRDQGGAEVKCNNNE